MSLPPRLALVLAVALGASILTRSVGAHAATEEDAEALDAIDRSAVSAMAAGTYAFCKTPPRPLGLAERRVCPLAREVEGCDALVAACQAATQEPKGREWLERFLAWISPVATGLLYALVLAIALLIALPILRAFRRRIGDRTIGKPNAADPNRAVVVEAKAAVADPSDADAVLLLAERERAGGRFDRALGLYLAASLAALDRRGALRLARHATNGEYVRACAGDPSQGALRDIVREVDAVAFGRQIPTAERLGRVASRAEAIVRKTIVIAGALAITMSSGCTPVAQGTDPTGDELPREVLRRSGYLVENLETSLATMAIAGEERDLPMPVVLVDAEKVALEPEARAHVVRWVEAGGTLVVFGVVRDWPASPAPEEHTVAGDARDLVVRVPYAAVSGARVARADGISWSGATPLATLDTATYAVWRYVGRGAVLAIANDDLFTNLGVLPRRNAAALVTLLRVAAPGGEVRIARAEDGVPPPGSPFAALVAAGLAKGAWHALAASVLLFLAFGVRRAAPRTPKPETRRAFTEHIEAAGSLYDRTHASAHALAVYARFVESRLHGNVPHEAGVAAYLAARSGAPPERVAELYARAATVKLDDEPRGDELTILEELRRLLVLAEPPPPRPQVGNMSASETTASATPAPGTR